MWHHADCGSFFERSECCGLCLNASIYASSRDGYVLAWAPELFEEPSVAIRLWTVFYNDRVYIYIWQPNA